MTIYFGKNGNVVTSPESYCPPKPQNFRPTNDKHLKEKSSGLKRSGKNWKENAKQLPEVKRADATGEMPPLEQPISVVARVQDSDLFNPSVRSAAFFGWALATLSRTIPSTKAAGLPLLGSLVNFFDLIDKNRDKVNVTEQYRKLRSMYEPQLEELQRLQVEYESLSKAGPGRRPGAQNPGPDRRRSATT